MKRFLSVLVLLLLLSGCGGSDSSSSSNNAAVDLLTEVDALMLTATDNVSEPVSIDNVIVSAPDTSEPKTI